MSLTSAERYRLHAGARRGLLENDLILERFFKRYGAVLDQEQAVALSQLLALDDNDLLELLLSRSNTVAALGNALESPVLQKLLLMLREK
ncbi:succinate dehydrogenase assembly factor 2 [Polynucleobacter sp. IMCC30063]|uniref:succinate dehydrogenase assembly factor 2 n=1 Tax=Polynucleobacter sp. IMCC30063 TaxID=2907298 RepID=UPI001F23A153|nr:succinate dehydrogenase assembly factor 2 [Polynucleobacter sp. IMCC30063]MCE7506044.1 succinate dehydrogenase assembly factor 2 [Polynucleobacter sp. IMCC30063]